MPIESGIAMVHIIRTARTYRNLLRHKGNRAGPGVAWAQGEGQGRAMGFSACPGEVGTGSPKRTCANE